MSIRSHEATWPRRPGSNSAEHAQLQFYFKDVGYTGEAEARLRARLSDVGFKGGGDFTLKLDLDDAGLARFEAAEQIAWEVEALLRRPPEPAL